MIVWHERPASGSAAIAVHDPALGGDGARPGDRARPDDPVAVIAVDNPLASGWTPPAGAPLAVAYSGTPGDDLFAPHPHTWMTPGWTALEELCARIAPALGDRTLCFQPHARHVLSDTPSTLRFLNDHAGDPFALALAPGALLEPHMLDDVEDHLERVFELLGPRARLLRLQDVTIAGDDCRPVPLGRGVLPAPLIRELIDRHVAAGTPVVIGGDDLPAQLAWLAGVDADAAPPCRTP